MKYIGKISSVLLTVAFVVAIVFANNNKMKYEAPNLQPLLVSGENQPGFSQKKRGSIEVVYDKEEESIAQEINKPTETETGLRAGDKEIVPINDVLHSSKLIETSKTNSVYTKSTLVSEPEVGLTKQEIKALVQQYNANPTSITQSQKEIISNYIESENSDNDASVDRGAGYSAPSVVINELMYNPAMPLDANGDPDYGDDREFIELYNTTEARLMCQGGILAKELLTPFHPEHLLQRMVI